jgi:hypothetical protein
MTSIDPEEFRRTDNLYAAAAWLHGAPGPGRLSTEGRS